MFPTTKPTGPFRDSWARFGSPGLGPMYRLNPLSKALDTRIHIQTPPPHTARPPPPPPHQPPTPTQIIGYGYQCLMEIEVCFNKLYYLWNVLHDPAQRSVWLFLVNIHILIVAGSVGRHYFYMFSHMTFYVYSLWCTYI